MMDLRCARLRFCGIALLLLAVPSRAAPAEERERAAFNGHVAAPPLAGAGESFEGTVFRRTEDGWLPISQGERIVYRGRSMNAGPGGTVVFPPFEDAGNHFLDDAISLPSSHASLHVKPAHVEVVRVAEDAPTQILHTSRILRAGGNVTALGQHLDRLRPGARLADRSGAVHDLGTPVFRSSIAVRWRIPPKLPPGPWLLEMFDERGSEIRAPDESYAPRIEVTGLEIRDLSEVGTFTVLSDTDVTVTISGGLPEARLLETRVDLVAGRAAEVHYTPLRRGRLRVTVEPESVLDDPAPEDAPGVDAQLLPVEVRYDRGTNATEVRAPARLLDPTGAPLPNRPVGMVLSQPRGLEFKKLTTDDAGVATYVATLPGAVAAEAVRAHLWAARGTRWMKGCRCTSIDFAFKRSEPDDPKLKYLEGNKDSDSLKVSFVVDGTVKTDGSGSVTVKGVVEPSLSAYTGAEKDLQEFVALVKKRKHHLDAEEFDKAAKVLVEIRKFLEKLKLTKVDISLPEQTNEALTRTVTCDEKQKAGTFQWDPDFIIPVTDPATRIGTSGKPQLCVYVFSVNVTASCNDSARLRTLELIYVVGWKGTNPEETEVLVHVH